MDTAVPGMALLGLITALEVATAGAAPHRGARERGNLGTWEGELAAISKDVGAAAPQPAAGLGIADDAWASPEIATPRMDARPLPLRRDTPPWPEKKEGPDARGGKSWGRTTLALAGVVGLIGLLAWGYRVMAGGGPLRFAMRARHPGLIEVVGRTALSP